MVVSSHQAKRLLEPSLRPEESLEVVALATEARSLSLMVLLVVGLPVAFVAAVMVAGVDGRVPWVTAALVAGLIGSMALGVEIVKNTGRRYVVGLTQSRLLVGRFVGRSWLRIGSVWGYDRGTLWASGVRTRHATINYSPKVKIRRGRLELADHRISRELEFVNAVLPNNWKAFLALETAITPQPDPQHEAA